MNYYTKGSDLVSVRKCINVDFLQKEEEWCFIVKKKIQTNNKTKKKKVLFKPTDCAKMVTFFFTGRELTKTGLRSPLYLFRGVELKKGRLCFFCEMKRIKVT